MNLSTASKINEKAIPIEGIDYLKESFLPILRV